MQLRKTRAPSGVVSEQEITYSKIKHLLFTGNFNKAPGATAPEACSRVKDTWSYQNYSFSLMTVFTPTTSKVVSGD